MSLYFKKESARIRDGYVCKSPPIDPKTMKKKKLTFKKHVRWLVLEETALKYYTANKAQSKGEISLSTITYVEPRNDLSSGPNEHHFMIHTLEKVFDLSIHKLDHRKAPEQQPQYALDDPVEEVAEWVFTIRLQCLRRVVKNPEKLFDFLSMNQLITQSLPKDFILFKLLELNEYDMLISVLGLPKTYGTTNCTARMKDFGDLKNDKGKSLLHISAREDHWELAQVILDNYDCDVSIRDDEGHSALEIALTMLNFRMAAKILMKDTEYSFNFVKSNVNILSNIRLKQFGFDCTERTMKDMSLIDFAGEKPEAESLLEEMKSQSQLSVKVEKWSTFVPSPKHPLDSPIVEKEGMEGVFEGALKHALSLTNLRRDGEKQEGVEINATEMYANMTKEQLLGLIERYEQERKAAIGKETERFEGEKYRIGIEQESEILLVSQSLTRAELLEV